MRTIYLAAEPTNPLFKIVGSVDRNLVGPRMERLNPRNRSHPFNFEGTHPKARYVLVGVYFSMLLVIAKVAHAKKVKAIEQHGEIKAHFSGSYGVSQLIVRMTGGRPVTEESTVYSARDINLSLWFRHGFPWPGILNKVEQTPLGSTDQLRALCDFFFAR